MTTGCEFASWTLSDSPVALNRFADIVNSKAQKDIPGHEKMNPIDYAIAQKSYVIGPDIPKLQAIDS